MKKYKDTYKEKETIDIFKMYDILKIIGITRPDRLLKNVSKVWENVSVENTEKAKVISVTNIGPQITYTVTTDISTYIAEGMLSHNCKAIVCGADAVMCGSIFAGCKETPGDVYKKGDPFEISENKIKFDYFTSDSHFISPNPYVKKYRGMASKQIQMEYNLWDGNPENLFVEGKEIEVPYTNESVTDVVYFFNNGLRSAMLYLGFTNLKDMKGSIWPGETKAIRIN